MRGFSVLVALVFVLAISGLAHAQTGAREFAARLDSSRAFYHDRSYGGAEVIYRSSGVATPEAARASWLGSQKGHRELLLSGSITDVQCVGGVCVGRGPATTSKTVTRSRSVTRGWFRRR